MNPTEPTSERPVVVIGGGISGLTAAYELTAAGIPALLFEASSRTGGVIETTSIGGHLFEGGPNTVQSTSATLMGLVDRLQLRSDLVESQADAHRRLVWRHGRVHVVPSGPLSLLSSGLISMGGKLRLFREPFVAPMETLDDETLLEFFNRRLGPEVTQALADPFVAGVFAGRLDALGVDAFPRLRAMVESHGSLYAGIKASSRERARAGLGRASKAPLVSFKRGLRALPAALHHILGSRVHVRREVQSVAPDDGGWMVRTSMGDLLASQVIVATPIAAARALIGAHCPRLGQLAETLDSPHVASIGLAYDRGHVNRWIDSFGLLVASDGPPPGGADVLGMLFPSSVFEGRAPSGEVNVRVMIGGARDPSARGLHDSELVDRARGAVAAVLGVSSQPSAVHVSRYMQAIPQYPPGHAGRVGALLESLAQQPGLHVAGNYLAGVGLESSAASGIRAALAVLGRGAE